jgi:hypothetical protein
MLKKNIKKESLALVGWVEISKSNRLTLDGKKCFAKTVKE